MDLRAGKTNAKSLADQEKSRVSEFKRQCKVEALNIADRHVARQPGCDILKEAEKIYKWLIK